METKLDGVEAIAHLLAGHPPGAASCDRSATADIRAAVRIRDVAQAMIEESVHTARGLGVTWAEIGLALGVSAQGARQRYS